MHRLLSLVIIGLCVGSPELGQADDGTLRKDVWSQFRGPTGQGHAAETRFPTKWNEKLNVAWKQAIPGRGHSSPVIWGDQIWMTTASPNGQSLGAICCNRLSGKIVHSITIFKPEDIEEIHADNTYASPTPVIEAGRLYVDFGTYGAACLDTNSGEVIWRNNNLKIEHQGGPGSSPVLYEDLLIIHRDGADQQYVAALDKANGEIRWKRTRSAPFRENPITHRAFATPLLADFNGQTQLISPGADQLHSYDPANGEELWHVRYVGFSTVPCPAADDEAVYFCTGYFKPQFLAVGMDGSGDVTKSHLRWTYNAQVPDTPSPLIVDGRIYLVSNKGIATCLDAKTGERIWIKRLGGNYSASPLYAGGHIYFCSEEGVTRVLIPGDEAEIVSVNKLDGAIMASPIALGSEIYIRTEESLYRIEEPGE